MDIVLKKGLRFTELPVSINGYKLTKMDIKEVVSGDFQGSKLRAVIHSGAMNIAYCTRRKIYVITRKGVKYFESMAHVKGIHDISNFTWIKEVDSEAIRGSRSEKDTEALHREYVSMHRVYPAFGKIVNLENRHATSNELMDMDKMRIKVSIKRRRR
jgi:hypothetical protein